MEDTGKGVGERPPGSLASIAQAEVVKATAAKGPRSTGQIKENGSQGGERRAGNWSEDQGRHGEGLRKEWGLGG